MMPVWTATTTTLQQAQGLPRLLMPRLTTALISMGSSKALRREKVVGTYTMTVVSPVAAAAVAAPLHTLSCSLCLYKDRPSEAVLRLQMPAETPVMVTIRLTPGELEAEDVLRRHSEMEVASEVMEAEARLLLPLVMQLGPVPAPPHELVHSAGQAICTAHHRVRWLRPSINCKRVSICITTPC
jgi:hypothetical protein